MAITAGTALSTTPFSCVASSSGGGRLFAATFGSYVWGSDDSGITWVKIKQESAGYSGVACDSTGTTIFAVVFGGLMYRFVPLP